MKYKNIEVGKWYYVRWFEYSRPNTVYKMQVIQKYNNKKIIVIEDTLQDPSIVSHKQILAVVLEKQEEQV